jgi:hypothetical protein
MTDWAIVTVVTRNYLHFTRALAVSLRAAHPEVRILACVVDPLPQRQKAEAEPFEVISFEALGIPQSRRFLFQYTPFELTCALKSYVLLHVFKQTNLRKLLYLDSDIQVYSELMPLLGDLDGNDIVLTPHLACPKSLKEPDHWEMDLLDTGIFNGGFIGVGRSETSLAMLEWWRQRMEKWCIQQHQHDQKWLNGVPALFDRVYIERGTQYNVAPWNTADRRFAEDQQGRVLVDGRPLAFFHFASIEPGQNKTLSRISRYPLAEEHSLVQRLFREYVARLQSCGMEECRSWGYEYSRLTDGAVIPPEWRELIRKDHPKFQGVEDPFAIPASEFRRAAMSVNLNLQIQRVRRTFKI